MIVIGKDTQEGPIISKIILSQILSAHNNNILK